MGGIHFAPGHIQETVLEIVGFKAGMSLSVDDVSTHISDEELLEVWKESMTQFTRLRSEEFEALVLHVLKAIGNIPDDSVISPMMRLLASRKEKASFEVRQRVVELWGKWLPSAMAKATASGTRLLDPTPLMIDVARELGKDGVEFATKVLLAANESMHRNPWGQVRRVEWTDTAELRDLFDSESLQTAYGHFIDQRFVDYLNQNTEQLGTMNWRKFEGLVSEFFIREGYHVDIGKGRADGGVDIRVWRDAAAYKAGPPLIVIQCKRQKADVEQVVVKALWADMVAEGATSGLIVTTSRLAPGAKRVCTARAYPIEAVERDKLGAWLEQMRTPWTGYIAW